MSIPTEEEFLRTPAMGPPPGAHQDLNNPSSIMTVILPIILVSFCVATLSTSVHFYTVARLIRKVSCEDYALYISWIFLTVFTAVTSVAAFAGGGTHQWDLTYGQLEDVIKKIDIALVFYSVTLIPLKVSIVLKGLKVFVSPGKRSFVYWASYMIIWAHTLFYFLFIIFIIFGCSPRKARWDLWVQMHSHARCVNEGALIWASTIFNVFTDVVMLAMPQAIIWRMKLDRKRKTGLSILFGFGVLACAASTCRLYYAAQYNLTGDKTFNIGIQGLLAFLEIAAGFLIACLPMLPKFSTVVLKRPFFPSPDRRPIDFRTVCEPTVPKGAKGRRWPMHDNDSNRELIMRNNVIHVTHTYQVLFEDADPATLRSISDPLPGSEGDLRSDTCIDADVDAAGVPRHPQEIHGLQRIRPTPGSQANSRRP